MSRTDSQPRFGPDDVIVSPRNKLVRDVARLRRREDREASGTLAAEGPRTLAEALTGGVHPHLVLYRCDAPHGLLTEARVRGARLVEVSDAVLERLCSRDRPEGIVSVLPLPRHDLGSLVAGPDALFVVVEAMANQGNLGAVVRSACGAGADAVIVCDRRNDVFSPGAVRASLGMVYRVQIAVTASSEAIAWLGAHDVGVVAATPASSMHHWDVDLTGRIAIAIGNERTGLSDPWLRAARARVRIPMPGPTDSLNATTAAGILLWEAVRQRAGRHGAAGSSTRA